MFSRRSFLKTLAAAALVAASARILPSVVEDAVRDPCITVSGAVQWLQVGMMIRVAGAGHDDELWRLMSVPAQP